jgi:endo-alpha-1,4-polygalactosaminidase (GH114 family)
MIQNFLYWLTDIRAGQLRQSDYDLIVVETGQTFRDDPEYGLSATLTPRQLRLVQQNDTPGDASDDRPVLGYVNIAVTDHYRDYWQDWWVTPDEILLEGELPANGDVGTVHPDAPKWLSNPLGEARGPRAGGDLPAPDNPDETIYGPIVDYVNETQNPDGSWDPDSWHAIVIAQAEAVINAGYDGVFLDDISRYYLNGGNVGDTSLIDRAEATMALVNDVADAIHAINPDAFVAINGGVYLRWDNGQGVTAEETAFFDNVDFVLLENLFTTEAYALADAVTNFSDHTTVLSVEWQDTLQAPGAYAQFASDQGFLTHIPDDPGYDEFTPLPSDPPPAPEFNVIIGTWQGEEIIGTSGADVIYAMDGDDTVRGKGGDDTILGLDGDDLLFGGKGRDLLIGGDGADTLNGQSGRDVLLGYAGEDDLRGGSGRDTLAGGDGADLLDAGRGAGSDLQGNATTDDLPGWADFWL